MVVTVCSLLLLKDQHFSYFSTFSVTGRCNPERNCLARAMQSHSSVGIKPENSFSEISNSIKVFKVPMESNQKNHFLKHPIQLRFLKYQYLLIVIKPNGFEKDLTDRKR